jgi:hypothetical protein
MLRTLIATMLLGGLPGIFTVFESGTVSAQTTSATVTPAPPARDRLSRKHHWNKRRIAFSSRPRYSERKLREDNITDVEILEIQQITKALVPGAIVNIGGVWDSCPCEDGDSCVNQVWVVASASGQSTGVMLSKINNQWGIGPVQEWWFDYEKYEADWRRHILKRRNADLSELALLNEERDFLRELQLLLLERFPYCAADESELPD